MADDRVSEGDDLPDELPLSDGGGSGSPLPSELPLSDDDMSALGPPLGGEEAGGTSGEVGHWPDSEAHPNVEEAAQQGWDTSQVALVQPRRAQWRRGRGKRPRGTDLVALAPSRRPTSPNAQSAGCAQASEDVQGAVALGLADVCGAWETDAVHRGNAQRLVARASQGTTAEWPPQILDGFATVGADVHTLVAAAVLALSSGTIANDVAKVADYLLMDRPPAGITSVEALSCIVGVPRKGLANLVKRLAAVLWCLSRARLIRLESQLLDTTVRSQLVHYVEAVQYDETPLAARVLGTPGSLSVGHRALRPLQALLRQAALQRLSPTSRNKWGPPRSASTRPASVRRKRHRRWYRPEARLGWY